MAMRVLVVLALLVIVGDHTNAYADVTPNPALPLLTPFVGDAGGASGSSNITDPVPGNIDLAFDGDDPDCAGFSFSSDVTDRATPFSLTVQYVASTRGLVTCTILAYSANTLTPRGSLTVSGNARGPHLAALSTINIGDVRVLGNTTATGTLTLLNDGELPLTISSITSNNPVFSVGTIPSSPISIGFSANITITFDPTNTTTYSSALTVTTNGTPNAVRTTNANGRGTSAVIGVNDPMFGTTNIVDPGTTMSTNVTVTNTATMNPGILRVTSATITPPSATWLSIGAGQGCLAGQMSCTFAPALSISTTALVEIVCAPPIGATGMQVATVTFANDSDPGGDSTSNITCAVPAGSGPDDAGVDDAGVDDAGADGAVPDDASGNRDAGPDNGFNNPYANRGCATTHDVGIAMFGSLALVLRRRRSKRA
jgi:hypothetical protein